MFAIEAALRLKEGTGGSVTALTMGPETALKVLQEACAMGADEGCLLSGRAFAGADVLATSYALSQALRALGGFDLILCGRQTTDGDTAQVGPAIAAHLGLPCLCWVKGIKAVSESSVTVRQSVTGGEQVVTCPCPAFWPRTRIFSPPGPPPSSASSRPPNWSTAAWPSPICPTPIPTTTASGLGHQR